jgi:hypothetical protein
MLIEMAGRFHGPRSFSHERDAYSNKKIAACLGSID